MDIVKKYAIWLLLIGIILSFSLLFYVSAPKDKHQSYSIPSTDIDLYLQDNGTLHVKETIHYSFTGFHPIIYKRILLNPHQQLQNIKLSTQGAYSSFNQTNKETLMISLFSDPQKTALIRYNRDVDVTLEYDILNVVRFYNDTTELQYKMANDAWNKDIGKFNINIHLKSSDGVQYWLNPPYYAENSSWQGNTLQIASKTIPSEDFFEVRMVIPKNQFTKMPKNGTIINQNGLSEIEKNQADYQNPIYFRMNLYWVLSVLLLLGSFIPLIIYLRYGREPKINYHAKYEVDLPTSDPPAIVNAICGSGTSRMGEPDMNGFIATIMDLINRNYLLLKDMSSDNADLNSSDSLFLEINPDYDPNPLWEFEIEVLNFLKEYEQEGIISLSLIFESLAYYNSAGFFKHTYKNWKKEVKNALLTDGSLKNAFLEKGDRYLKIFGLLGLVIAPTVIYYTSTDPIPTARYVLILSIILGFMAIISIILPQKIAGQWTTYGREYYARWHSFKKYIEDYSLIKEYSPKSVNVWNKYLVYATALGAADEVRKAMKISLPHDQLMGSDLYSFHHYTGPISLLENAITTALDSD